MGQNFGLRYSPSYAKCIQTSALLSNRTRLQRSCQQAWLSRSHLRVLTSYQRLHRQPLSVVLTSGRRCRVFLQHSLCVTSSIETLRLGAIANKKGARKKNMLIVFKKNGSLRLNLTQHGETHQVRTIARIDRLIALSCFCWVVVHGRS